ncbi:hypothetical protein SLNWT_4672 [Streptomyces albus]|uniref:Integral membrane protein n=1 Tax=Streptomyces albus (strain ATCC 21838 / DSM 41398 / FERM P-419 / JCM 4703 / NBRC 107858) TaxID=1081613 RepID=A0A0B5EQK4_STRA4|nr:hypothetical protein SLNWT_4672 [Streptomyces albus]AOU79355.1 hypothetical protein SLNHY_4664 [Streptomyces albus]
MRHDFGPGKLLAGLVLLTTALLYLGDAATWWHLPWYAVLPLVCGGLFLSAAVAVVGVGVRRRGRRRAAARAGGNEH